MKKKKKMILRVLLTIVVCFLLYYPVSAKIRIYQPSIIKRYVQINERRTKLIKTGLTLVGKTKYQSKAGSNKVSHLGKNPKYLCCSSFVSWCFYRSGNARIDYSTWNFCHSKKFKQISRKNLKIGDIGLIQNKRKYGNHVALYIGKNKKGQEVWLHCTGNSGRNGVVISTDDRLKVFYRYRGFVI